MPLYSRDEGSYCVGWRQVTGCHYTHETRVRTVLYNVVSSMWQALPSLKATPVSAANMGPTNQTAMGWCATYAGTASPVVRALHLCLVCKAYYM